jgi:hypothetical protein
LPSAKTLIEYEITPIPLPKEQAEASMEYSGLAWCGKNLILLPQYPEGSMAIEMVSFMLFLEIL